MMSRLKGGAKRRPLITFFVLAYALSWWPSILYVLDLSPQPVAGFGPFLAALIVLAVTRGKGGITGLLRRMVLWRVDLRWYAAALLLPVGLATAATTLNILLGARSLPPPSWVAGRTSSRPSPSYFWFPVSAGRGRSRAGGALPCRGCKPAARRSWPA